MDIEQIIHARCRTSTQLELVRTSAGKALQVGWMRARLRRSRRCADRRAPYATADAGRRGRHGPPPHTGDACPWPRLVAHRGGDRAPRMHGLCLCSSVRPSHDSRNFACARLVHGSSLSEREPVRGPDAAPTRAAGAERPPRSNVIGGAAPGIRDDHSVGGNDDDGIC